MAIDDIPRLGCGRSIDQIWATISHPPTTHEQHCDQCRAARARLQNLKEATRSLRESDTNNLALKPGPGIKQAIMNVARAEIRRSKRIPLDSNENGAIEISEQALSFLIRTATAAIPGLHARRCHIHIRSHSTSEELPGATAGSATSLHLDINLRVAAATGIEIPRTAQRLRHEINRAIPAGVGVSAGTINITVEDLYHA